MTSPHPCFVVTVPRLSLRYLSWTVVGPIPCFSRFSLHPSPLLITTPRRGLRRGAEEG